MHSGRWCSHPGRLPALALLWLLVCQGITSPAVNRTVFDSQIADITWHAHDDRTMLLRTQHGKLHRSTDAGVSWTDISDVIQNGSAVREIIQNPRNRNYVIVRMGDRSRTHYLSTNAGGSWVKFSSDYVIETFIFHPKRPKWALMSTWSGRCRWKAEAGGTAPCSRVLYFTTDVGKLSTVLSSHVVQFRWGDIAHGNEDDVFYSHFRDASGDQAQHSYWRDDIDFSVRTISGQKKLLVQNGNRFIMTSGYILVARPKSVPDQTLTLMISSDGGNKFNAAQFPEEIAEKAYYVLDVSDGAIVLNVNSGYTVSDLYVSDSDGLRFSLALQNNVCRRGQCAFAKVLNLDGIYVANIFNAGQGGDRTIHRASPEPPDDNTFMNRRLSEGAPADEAGAEPPGGSTPMGRRLQRAPVDGRSGSMRTVISWNKGGTWDSLKPPAVDGNNQPTNCNPPACTLHLHDFTEFSGGVFVPVYSYHNAMGILMGSGNLGESLNRDPKVTNTYISRDGGLTWQEARKGIYIYEYGNHGSLLIMAEYGPFTQTREATFSLNEGALWHRFAFSDAPVLVINILTELTARSTNFVVEAVDRARQGVLYHLDFAAIGRPMCLGASLAGAPSSDYETWSPWDGAAQANCLLGRQSSYTRRKQHVECFNDRNLERGTVFKDCECTNENFECEPGFVRSVDHDTCHSAGSAPANPQDLEACKTSSVYYVSAYRKVAGDTCKGGWLPPRVSLTCPNGGRGSGGSGWTRALAAVAALATLALAFRLGLVERLRDIWESYISDWRWSSSGGGIGNRHVQWEHPRTYEIGEVRGLGRTANF